MSISDRIAAYWPFNSTHGASVTDEYGGAHAIDGGTAGTAAGKVREALDLERDDSDFRSVSDHADLRQLKGCLVWVKLESKSNDMVILSKGSSAADDDQSIKLWYDTSEDEFKYTVGDNTTSTTVASTGLTIATETWYCIRCAADGERQTIWINETLYGSAAYRAPLSETGILYIGRDTSGNYFDGLIDELAVFSTAPTRADGQVWHNGGDGLSLPEFDSLPGSSGRGGFYNPWDPPSFAESDDGGLYIANGKRRLQAFDGYGSFRSAGVPGPASAPTLDSSGTGRIIGDLYGYVRFLDADGRVSRMSAISDVLKASGDARGAITGATNAAPIVITSASHGLTTGTRVRVTGQQGNTAANGFHYITSLTTDTFSLDGSVGNGDWLSSPDPSLQITKRQSGNDVTAEVQTISWDGTSTGGTFTVSFDGETTSTIAYNADASALQTAMESLGSVGSGNILVTEGTVIENDSRLTFIGDLNGTPHELVTVDASSLLGPSISITIAETTKGAAAVDEVQTISVSAEPSGGTFTLSFGGQVTSGIAHNASAATIETALETLSTIDAVTVGGGPFNTADVTVTFEGTNAATDVAMMVADGTSLSGSNVGIDIETTTDGTAGTNEVQTISLLGTPTGGTFTLSFGGQTTSGIAYNASASAVQSALESLSTIGSGNVSGGGGSLPGTDTTATFQGSLAATDVALMTFDPSSLTGGPQVAAAETTAGYPGFSPDHDWDWSEGSGGLRDNWYDGGSGTALNLSGAASGTSHSFPGFDGTSNLRKQLITTPNDGSKWSWTAGTFKITHSGDTTNAIAYNASAATVQSELEALASIGSGNVTVALNNDHSSSSGLEAGYICTFNFTPSLMSITSPSMSGSGTSGNGTVAVIPQQLTGMLTGSSPIFHTNELSGTLTSTSGNIVKNTSSFSVLLWVMIPRNYRGLSGSSTRQIANGECEYSTIYGAKQNFIKATSNSGLSLVWGIGYDTNEDKFYASIKGTSGTVYRVYSTSHGYATAGTWHMVSVRWNEETDTLGISIDAGTEDTVTVSGGSANVGTQIQVTGAGEDVWPVAYRGNLFPFMLGPRIWAFDDSVVSFAHVTSMYNSGAGIFATGSYPSGQSEVVTLTASNSPAAGTFRIGVREEGGASYEYTSDIAYNASVSTIESSLESLSLIDEDEIAVAGGAFPGTAVTLTFQNGLAETAMDVIVDDDKIRMSLTETTAGEAAASEVQTLTPDITPTAGTFTITHDSNTTGALNYNDNAATVQSALEGLASIGSGNVAVTGGDFTAAAFTLTFQGTLADSSVSEVTAASSMTGAAPTVSVAETTKGDPGADEVQTISASGHVAGTFTLTYGGQTTSALNWDATALEVDTALEALSSIGAGDVVVTGGPFNEDSLVVTFANSLAKTDVAMMTATTSLTGDPPDPTVTRTTTGKAAQNTIQQITAESVSAGSFTLTHNSSTTGLIQFDATALDIETALELLDTVDDVAVTGGPLTAEPVLVEFQGDDASIDIDAMTFDDALLLNGGWATGASSIDYTDVAVPTDTRVTRKQILRTKPGNADVAYVDIDTTDIDRTIFTSTKTDEDLTATDLVVLIDADGVDQNLERHGEPPNWMTSISSFQNRIFASGNYEEIAGAVQVDGTDADGAATDWPTIFDGRTLSAENASDLYVIDTIDPDDQQTTLTDNGETSSTTGPYTISYAEPEGQRIYHSWVTALDAFPESFYPTGPFQITRDERDGKHVGTFSFDGRLFAAFQNSIYRYSYDVDPAQAPTGDGAAYVAIPRGLVNIHCVAYTDDYVFCLDHQGVFRFDGNSVDGTISQNLKPIFTGEHSDTKIHWRHAQNFHATYFPSDRIVRFFVSLDGGKIPKHALCHNVDTATWWIEEYPYRIGASHPALINGEYRVLLGAEYRQIFTLSGTQDGSRNETSTLRGTVTAATAGSISDSSATFGSTLVGLPIDIVSGTGRGQTAIIRSVSGTRLFIVGRWKIRPDTTSTYQIAGVRWSVKTGKLRLTSKSQPDSTPRGVEIIWTPTDNAQLLDAKVSRDFKATAEKNRLTVSGALNNSFSTEDDSEYQEVDLSDSDANGTATFRIGEMPYPDTSSPVLIDIEAGGVTNDERHELHAIAVRGAN